MTYLYIKDHARITGYLRTYDPIEQYVDLLPYNDKSPPLIVPQEFLIYFDDLFVALQHSYANSKTSHCYQTSCFLSTRR